MIFFIALVVLLSLESEILCQRDAASTLEQRMTSALEAWRSGADPRLPPSDPLLLPPFSDVYQQFGIKITIATSETQLRGFKDMIIKELHVSNNTMQGSFRFLVPLIVLHAEKYEVNGRAYVVIRINCAGEATIKIDDADIRLNIQFGMADGRLSLKEISLDFNFKGVQKMKCFIVFGLSLLACANAGPYTEMIPMDESVRSMFDVSHVEFKRTWPEQSVMPSVSQLQNGQRNLVADRIREFLESYRDAIEHGSDNHPPLDPLEVEQFGPYSFRTDSIPSIRATVEVRDVAVVGLKWYVVDEVTFSLLRLGIGFHLTVPRITITGDYDAQARIALFITHNAAGAFRLFVNRVEVGGDMRLGVSTSDGGHLVLRDLDLQVDIHDTSIYIEGLVESGLINVALNWLLQNVSQDVIQSNRDEISQIVTDIVFDIVNEVLKDFTLNDLIN